RGRRVGTAQRRLRAARAGAGHAQLQRDRRPRAGKPDDPRARPRRRLVPDRPRPRPRFRIGQVPDERPVLRVRPDQRGVPDVTRSVVKLGGAVAAYAAEHVLDLVEDGHRVCVVHGAGPQISTEMLARGLPVQWVGGRRVTSGEALEVVRESLIAVNGQLCEALGPKAVGLIGHEIGLTATQVPSLGLVGDPVPAPLPAVENAIDAGLIPVVAPIARGPLNVNADEAAAAIAVSLEAERIFFMTDVPGLLLSGSVVPV